MSMKCSNNSFAFMSHDMVRHRDLSRSVDILGFRSSNNQGIQAQKVGRCVQWNAHYMGHRNGTLVLLRMALEGSHNHGCQCVHMFLRDSDSAYEDPVRGDRIASPAI